MPNPTPDGKVRVPADLDAVTAIGAEDHSEVDTAAIELLLGQDWRSTVTEISGGLSAGLQIARTLPGVADVRVRGAIGVIECDRPVDLAIATPAALDLGVWLRPFRHLVYAMPPFICTPEEIAQVTSAMVEVARLTGSRRL